MAKILALSGALTFGLSEWLGCKVVTEENITKNRNFKDISGHDKAKIASVVRENEFDFIIIRTSEDNNGAGLEKARIIKNTREYLCQQIIIVSVFTLTEAEKQYYYDLGIKHFTIISKVSNYVEQLLSLRKAV